MEKQVCKVENPVYLTKDEIREKYWDKQVLLTNIKMTQGYSRMAGGIVRYYAVDSKDELYAILNELRKTDGDEMLGSCGVDFIGNVYINLYADGDERAVRVY